METMTIQWSLVLFTALTGIGGWTFVCVAADEFLGRAKAAAFPAAVVAFALSAVGGLASVTHLSHPDRIMGALGHPTSGIFTEAVLVGCVCVFVAIYLVMLKRGASDGARKAVAVIGAVFGVLISFMAGESYLMSSRPNWDTQLLPLGYMLTAMPGGIACYLAVAAAKAKEAKLDQYAKALLVAGVLGVLGTVAFAVAQSQSGGTGYDNRPDFKRSVQPDGKTGFPQQIVLIKECLKSSYHDTIGEKHIPCSKTSQQSHCKAVERDHHVIKCNAQEHRYFGRTIIYGHRLPIGNIVECHIHITVSQYQPDKIRVIRC